MIDELSYKLEFKAFETQSNIIKWPNTKQHPLLLKMFWKIFLRLNLRPQIYDIILKSKYELAVNSIYDLKKERLMLQRHMQRELQQKSRILIMPKMLMIFIQSWKMKK
jgi:uncharacterized protein (UPF0332 family)